MQHPRVVLLPQTALGEFDVLTVQCLSFGSRQVALTSSGALLELNVMQRKLGSWLIDDTVEGKGQLFVATPLDVVLVMLPLLVKQGNQFRPLDDVVSEGGASYLKLASRISNLASLCAVVCETKVVPGIQGRFVRLSRDKMFRWLLCKVEAVKKAVADGKAGRSATLGGAGVSRSLNMGEGTEGTVKIDAKAAEAGQLQAAVDLVRDYVGDEWGAALCSHYGLAPQTAQTRFAQSFAPVEVGPTTSIASLAQEEKKAEALITAGQKRLRKVDTSGMKKMTDLFGKRPKPAQEKK